MAKIQWSQEWKLWAACGALFVLIVGYLYFVSRPPREDGEYLWRVDKVVNENTLAVKGSGTALEFRLAGLKIPPNYRDASQEFLGKTLLNQWVKLRPIRDVKEGSKEGFMYLSGEDITARLIRNGFALIDRDERGFDVRPYIELEDEAQRAKRGLWAPEQGAK